jgi:hypothetical protein
MFASKHDCTFVQECQEAFSGTSVHSFVAWNPVDGHCGSFLVERIRYSTEIYSVVKSFVERELECKSTFVKLSKERGRMRYRRSLFHQLRTVSCKATLLLAVGCILKLLITEMPSSSKTRERSSPESAKLVERECVDRPASLHTAAADSTDPSLSLRCDRSAPYLRLTTIQQVTAIRTDIIFNPVDNTR